MNHFCKKLQILKFWILEKILKEIECQALIAIKYMSNIIGLLIDNTYNIKFQAKISR